MSHCESRAINQGFWGFSVHISTSDAAYQKVQQKIVAKDNNSRLMCYQSQCKTKAVEGLGTI